MSFPGFPPGLPRLIDNAPELSPDDRSWIASLLPHQRAEAERTIRNTSAIFAKIVRDNARIAEEQVVVRRIVGGRR